MTIFNLTLAQLRTDLKTRLDEVSADGLWATSELNTQLNRAYLRVQMDTEQYTRTATINLLANLGWYSLPTDCLVPKYLYGPTAWNFERIYPTTLAVLDRADRGLGSWEKDTPGISLLFIPFSWDKFILWPAPSSTTTISLFYAAIPIDLSADSDTTVLDPQAQKLLPIYAAYLALRKDRFDKAVPFLQEYRQRLGIVKSELANHASYKPTQMRPAGWFDRAQKGDPTFRLRP